jgi:hypothetical protein
MSHNSQFALLLFLAFALLSGCGVGLTEGEDIVLNGDDDGVSGDDADASGDDDDALGDDDDLSGDDDDSLDPGDDDDSLDPGDDDDSQAGSGLCTEATSVVCGETLAGDTRDGAASNEIDVYPCSSWDATGPEIAFSYTALESGTVHAALTEIEEGQDLDIYILQDEGNGCSSDGCIAYADSETDFEAVAGQTYYILVDGYYGAAGSFVLDLSCGEVTPGDDDDSVGDDDDSVGDDDDSVGDDDDSVGDDDDSVSSIELCDDGMDNDGDGAVDCGDADCANDLNCTGGVCVPAGTLVDGSVSSWDNGGVGSTNAVNGYSCQPNWDESGPEFAYYFVASQNGQATVNVTEVADEVIELLFGPLDDLDVFVLDGNGACDPSACVAGGDSTVSWTVTTGSAWYIVVDGYQGDQSAYDLSLNVVPSTPSSETNCTDGQDEDGDGVTDCDDSDCSADPACQTPTCAVADTLTCGDTRTWNNGDLGSTTNVGSYSCTGWNESGPEYTYEFVSPAPHDVTLSLSGMSGDLDLFVLDAGTGSCDPSNCSEYGDSSTTFTAVPGQSYYVVVDGFAGAISDYTLEVTCN